MAVGNGIGAPMDYGAPFGGVYQGEDLSDEKGQVEPSPATTPGIDKQGLSRSYDGPGQDPLSATTPYENATEEAQDEAESVPLRTFVAQLIPAHKDHPLGQLVRERGADNWTPVVSYVATELVQVLGRDPRRRSVRFRNVGADGAGTDATVYLVPDGRSASTTRAISLEVTTTPSFVSLDVQGEVWAFCPTAVNQQRLEVIVETYDDEPRCGCGKPHHK